MSPLYFPFPEIFENSVATANPLLERLLDQCKKSDENLHYKKMQEAVKLQEKIEDKVFSNSYIQFIIFLFSFQNSKSKLKMYFTPYSEISYPSFIIITKTIFKYKIFN